MDRYHLKTVRVFAVSLDFAWVQQSLILLEENKTTTYRRDRRRTTRVTIGRKG